MSSFRNRGPFDALRRLGITDASREEIEGDLVEHSSPDHGRAKLGGESFLTPGSTGGLLPRVLCLSECSSPDPGCFRSEGGDQGSCVVTLGGRGAMSFKFGE